MKLELTLTALALLTVLNSSCSAENYPPPVDDLPYYNPRAYTGPSYIGRRSGGVYGGGASGEGGEAGVEEPMDSCQSDADCVFDTMFYPRIYFCVNGNCAFRY